MLHQGCVSYNTISCSARSFAQKAYKRFYLHLSQTDWTRKAFLLHKAVTSCVTETRPLFSTKKWQILPLESEVIFVEAWQ